MKILQSPITNLLFLLLICSCNIEPYDGDTEIISNEPGIFKVDFDGQTFKTNQVVTTVVDGAINISGINTNSEDSFLITFFGNEEGTYQLGVTQNQVEVNSITYISNTSTTTETWLSLVDFTKSQGELVITEIDEINKTISGNFFFTGHMGSSSKEFTNGSFYKIPYDEGLSENENSFFANIDGSEFVEDTVSGSLLSVPGVPSLIMISATKNNLQTISITVNSNITVGSYSFTDADIPLGQYNTSLTDTYLSDTGGELIIIEHDVANKRIIGTFRFTANPFLTNGAAVEITEGSFDISYI